MVHRWEGGAATDWYPWLRAELERLNYEVDVLDMPNSKEPKIEEWVEYLEAKVGALDENTYFVGHSIGCQAILRYLERQDNSKAGGAIFVAGWFNLEGLEEEGEEVVAVAKPWIETPIDLKKVRSILLQSILLISSNDPYGALEENKKNFSELGTKIVQVENAGHFCKEDGYKEFPLLLEELKAVLGR